MNESSVYMGKISYINASPVYYGLDHGLLPPWLKMVADVPAALNHKLISGEIKISPISAAFYAMNHRQLLLLPQLSISCNGKVLSVVLVTNYAMDDLTGKTVMFSKESASAAALLKMIFHQRNIEPVYTVGDVNDFKKVGSQVDAALVIGDAALVHPWDQEFKYRIDLGQFWHEMTGLPFVFAVWAVRRSFAQKFPDTVTRIHQILLESKKSGYENLDQIIKDGQNKLGIPQERVKHYYDLLYCDLDDQKIKAMGVFFDSLYERNILKLKVDIQFF